MALMRASALGALALGGVIAAAGRVPGPGLGGGGGTGRDGAGVGLAAGAPGFAAGPVTLAAGQPATFGGGAAPPAVSGVPHRAQNLKLAAFSVMQFGHCLGGPPDCCSRGPGVRAAGFIMVGAAASSAGKATPHERHEPTSVSL